MTQQGRTDEPLTTDAEVRNRRARRMADLIRKLHGADEAVNEVDDDLARWISKCLLAHEVDTLTLLAQEGAEGALKAKARQSIAQRTGGGHYRTRPITPRAPSRHAGTYGTRPVMRPLARCPRLSDPGPVVYL
jgi:hypothetical protein